MSQMWRFGWFASQAGFRSQNSSRHDRRLRVESLEDRRLLAVVPNGFTETVVASNLTTPTTLDIEASGRIWLAFQDGRIEVIENDVLNPQIAYQLDADSSAEHGLQGLELDPNFESNGYIYVHYTANSPSPHNRVSRLTVDPNTENTILANSEVVLLELPNLSDYSNPPYHIGGAIHFALDGTLLVQVGEMLQSLLAQDVDSPLGKVLRINADGSVPTDNPFYDAGDGITWKDHVWALGLRNPFAGDLDPETGRYFIADVGQKSWEEINDATAPGLNFGWPSTEGEFDLGAFPDFTNPYHAYPSTSNTTSGMGCAITGGAFERGAAQFPTEYEGKFFFADYCVGEIRVIDPDDPNDLVIFATDANAPLNIEFASDGSMYYISRGLWKAGDPTGLGSVRKVQYSPPPAALAADFDTNGVVDGKDFLAWQIGFGTPAPDATKGDGDADDDLDVDGVDLAIWESQYGTNPVSADFDMNGIVDGEDFLVWQRGYGTLAPNATRAVGDADNDLGVDSLDLAVWESQYGTSPALLAAAATPASEPASASPQESQTVAATAEPLSAELVDAAIVLDRALRSNAPSGEASTAPLREAAFDASSNGGESSEQPAWSGPSETAKHSWRGQSESKSDRDADDDAVNEALLDELFAKDPLNSPL